MSDDASSRVRHRAQLRAGVLFFVSVAAMLFGFVRFGGHVEQPITEATAGATAWLLRILGTGATVAEGTLVQSRLATLRIIFECTAVFPCMFFVAGVVAYPAPFAFKGLGLLLGLPAILAVNEVRLVSLFYIAHWLPQWFDTAHWIVWQSAILFTTLLFWLLWAARAPRTDVRSSAGA
ncbi:MAG: hypothetical protein GY716_22240 [bacterium]|nr:hypothetical protein [bacterium]